MVNNSLFNFLLDKGVDRTLAYGFSYRITEEIPQFNEKTRLRVVNLKNSYRLTVPYLYEGMGKYLDLVADSSEYGYDYVQRVCKYRIKIHYIRMVSFYDEVIIRAGYNPIDDELLIDPVVHYYPFEYKMSSGQYTSSPKCPRCGSIDFSSYGVNLPKWLRIKNVVTCNCCGNTLPYKEFI